MIRRPPRSTRTDTLFPDTTLFRSGVDREACALYKQALDKYLPPEYSVPVYTSGAADSIDYPLVAQYQVDPAQEKSIRKQFRKADRLPKILIVTDKLLTGFDEIGRAHV